MSRKIKNVNAMLSQLARIQEQLRHMRELIEEEVGKGVTRLFIEGAGAEEIYAYVEKIIAGSGYLEYVKMKKEKERKREEEKKKKEVKLERQKETEDESEDGKIEEVAGDSFWA